MWVLIIQCKQLPGGLEDLGQGEIDLSHLETFVPEPILSDQLQVLVKA